MNAQVTMPTVVHIVFTITDAVNEVEKQAPTVSNGVWYVSSGYLYKVASGNYQNLGLPRV